MSRAYGSRNLTDGCRSWRRHAYASIEPLRRREVLLGRLLPRRRSRYPHLNWTAPQSRSIHHVELRFLKKATAYAKRASRQGVRFFDAASELARRIHSDFVYDPEATEVSTPPEEAFDRRRGVCQDFAHIMIAAVRGISFRRSTLADTFERSRHQEKNALRG